VAVYLDGADDPDRAADGTPLTDDDFLLLVNAWWEPLGFTVPVTRPGQLWEPEIDTYDPPASPRPEHHRCEALLGPHFSFPADPAKPRACCWDNTHLGVSI
jgi:hypothetical protein